MKNEQGFTLIEVLLVVGIMVALAAYVGSNIIGRLDDAKVTSAVNQIQALELGLRLYRLDNGEYPSQEQGLRALLEQPNPAPRNWNGPYIEGRLPKDPWGNEYQYRIPPQQGFHFDLYSSGPKPGQEIGNWQNP